MKNITLRIPDDLHRELTSQADDEQRSLNGHILYLLRQALARVPHAQGYTNASEDHRHRQ